ncbi:glycoside hydrolase family 2 protein [Novosphingobium sp.]|jgi:hypothetical protein|uniref:glycoside hydrolase family 2 protein n=1 Tax=Novosphingobium sp. TaxID=1874826 RepID=UPI002FE32114
MKAGTLSAAAVALAACSVATALPVSAHDASNAVPTARKTFSLNRDWRQQLGDVPDAATVRFDDSAWKPVTLPNAFNETEAFAHDIKDLSTGIIWYRKRFTLPVADIGRRAFLEFEGVRQAAEVFVNGKSVALSENGAMAFGADITDALVAGDNIIAVRVDNDWRYKERASGSGFQWNDRNFNVNYGGITKNVKLHLTGALHQTLPLMAGLGTTGQYVWADAFDLPGKAATIHAETQVRNDDRRARHLAYRVEVRAPDGTRVAALDGGSHDLKPGETAILSASARLSGLQFWSWGYGYLYTVTTVLLENGKAIDSVDTVTGFRQTAYDHGMIRLNGRIMQVHGYAQRTSNEWPAVGVSVPPWLSDFSNALMVESGGNMVRWMHITPSKQDIESADRVGLPQAMPAGDSEKDVTGRRWEQRKEVMQGAIVYNRNNPSILFYESGNNAISEAHMAEMKTLRDTYDPHGGRAIGAREMLDSKIAEYGGEMLYINKSARIPMWSMEYSRDEGARLYQDAFTAPFHPDAPDYNRNQDSHAIENVRRWYEYYRMRPGTGERVSSGGVNIVFSDTNTHHRGDNNYRRSGEVDAMRLPKEGFFAHKVMWNDWVDSTTPATHLIGHWNYAPGTKKDIHAVSNGEDVELRINGRSLGKGERSEGFLFTWHGVAWEPGKIEAVAVHSSGARSQDMVETTGQPASLRLTPHTSPRGFVMDGADLALVDVEVLDAQGRRVPTAGNLIHFSLEGPAEWRGGIAQGRADNYILSAELPVEGGINRILLRGGNRPGAIRLKASAAGLKDAAIAIRGVRASPLKGGLTPDLPGSAQAGLLTRGPTPAGSSYRQSRTTLIPVTATAGAAQDQAAASWDDNELSRWSSDGSPRNAWIEYRFAQNETISEIDTKLIGWRSRSYPLRVKVDDRTVWEGETERQLGYARISFPPTRGTRVRIEMTGPVADRDAFGNVVELDTARKAGDTGADEIPPGWNLAISEIEFHGPVAPEGTR